VRFGISKILDKELKFSDLKSIRLIFFNFLQLFNPVKISAILKIKPLG
jgi:hypothetical protein